MSKSCTQQNPNFLPPDMILPPPFIQRERDNVRMNGQKYYAKATYKPPEITSDHNNKFSPYFQILYDTLQRARATTKKIETPADVDGFPELNDPEKQEIKDLIKECVTSKPPPKTKKAVRTTLTGDTSKSLGQ